MSDENNANTDVDDAIKQKEPVGLRLKALREQKNKSLDEFVAFSALPKKRVEAFELAHYDKVGIDTFVVGYIRKYANWLNVDANIYIGDYHREPDTHKNAKQSQNVSEVVGNTVLVSKSQAKLSTSIPGRKSRVFSHTVIALIVMILVCSLVLAVFFIINHTDNIADNTAQPNTSLVEIPPNSGISNNASDNTSAFTVSQTLIERSIDTSADATDDSQTPNIISSTPLQIGSSQESESLELSTDNTADALAEFSLRSTPNVAQQALADTPNVTVLSNADTLNFSFSQDCWLEISSQGEILFAGLKRAGSTHSQQGQAPFGVMLGNVQAATLIFNDAPFDIQPIPGRNTLRFTVGRN